MQAALRINPFARFVSWSPSLINLTWLHYREERADGKKAHSLWCLNCYQSVCDCFMEAEWGLTTITIIRYAEWGDFLTLTKLRLVISWITKVTEVSFISKASQNSDDISSARDIISFLTTRVSYRWILAQFSIESEKLFCFRFIPRKASRKVSRMSMLGQKFSLKIWRLMRAKSGWKPDEKYCWIAVSNVYRVSTHDRFRAKSPPHTSARREEKKTSICCRSFFPQPRFTQAKIMYVAARGSDLSQHKCVLNIKKIIFRRVFHSFLLRSQSREVHLRFVCFFFARWRCLLFV